jgi:hypothetical protein
MEELIKTYEQYVNLLFEEISELRELARLHSWKSSRIEKGKELREKIEKYKKWIEPDGK